MKNYFVKKEKPTSQPAIQGKIEAQNRGDRNNWEKVARTCLYLMIFLVPLFFLPLTRAPLEINKQVLAIILVLIAFFCYLIYSLKKRVIAYPRSLLSLGILLFLITFLLSTIFSRVFWVSFFGNLSQPDSFLIFLIYGAAFFLMTVLFKKGDLKKIGFCFFISLALVTIFGLFQALGKFILPWSFAQQKGFNPIGPIFGWGIFLGFGLVTVISLLAFELSKISKFLLSLLGLLIVLIFAFLNYPMLWWGLVLTMILIIVCNFALTQTRIELPTVILIISLFCILISQFLPFSFNLPLEIRPNLSSTLIVAKETLLSKRLLVGSGPATFLYNFTLFRPIELNQTAFWSVRFDQGFSFLTTFLTTNGLFGILAAFFLLFVFLFVFLRESLENRNFLIIGPGLFFLIVNLFFYPASFVHLLFIFLVFGFLSVEQTKEIKIGNGQAKKIRALANLIGLIFLIALNLVLLYLVCQKYVAAIYYQKGVESPSLDRSLSYLNKAVILDPQSDLYLRTLSQGLLLKVNEFLVQNNQIQIQNHIALSIDSGQKATKLNRVDSLNWLNLASIYENISPIVQRADFFAEENYLKGQKLDPKNPQIFVDLARLFIISTDLSQEANLKQEKLNKAKGLLEKSLALKSDYAPAHFQIAMISVREGKIKEAINKLEAMKLTLPFDTGLAFQLGLLYYNNKDFEKAQVEFERAIGLNENYSNARYFLGLILDQKGKKQAAIEQFERIEKLNPENQEVKKILANLKASRQALEGIVPPAQLPEERIKAPVSETPE